MPLFALICTDHPGREDLRRATRAAAERCAADDPCAQAGRFAQARIEDGKKVIG